MFGVTVTPGRLVRRTPHSDVPRHLYRRALLRLVGDHGSPLCRERRRLRAPVRGTDRLARADARTVATAEHQSVATAVACVNSLAKPTADGHAHATSELASDARDVGAEPSADDGALHLGGPWVVGVGGGRASHCPAHYSNSSNRQQRVLRRSVSSSFSVPPRLRA